MRPTVLDDIGLVAAIKRLVETFRARLGLTVTVDFGDLDDHDRLPRETETVIYRIAQESLTNVARHSGVQTAVVEVTVVGDNVTVEVRDDGSGFDASLAIGSLGLTGMHERAALVGGTLHIVSSPGAGTTVRLETPRA